MSQSVCSPGRLRQAVVLCLLSLMLLAVPTEADAARRGAHVCGRQAAASLGADLPGVAARHRRSQAQLEERFQRDRTLCVDKAKRLYYVDSPAPPRRTLADATLSAAPFPLLNTFKLHSKPGAAKTIFLDFDGHTVAGTAWNVSSGQPTLLVPPFNTPSTDDPATFSASERALIQGIWQRMAEDFIPFDVDVTTEFPGEAALTRTDAGDAVYGVRILFAGYSKAQVDDYFGPAGGIAYVGSLNDIQDFFKPAFVFPEYLGPYDEKAMAEAGSHEAGHTAGLDHDGRQFPAEEYYEGHGAEPMTWAPIMGVGYYNTVVQWSKGEYASANNTQDDVAIIGSMVGFRSDDHADSTAVATPLSGIAFSASGIIGSAADQDVFSFTSNGGAFSLRVQPAPNSPNLDLQAEVLDSLGGVVAMSNPALELGAVVDVPVAAGSYHLRVSGVGFGTPDTGYSDYGSLGQYTVRRVLPASIGGQNLRIAAESAVLTWDAGAAQTAYLLLRTTVGAGSQTMFGPLAAGATSYTDTTAAPGGLYCYLLVPIDSLGILGTSDMQCALPGITTGPAVPSAFTLAMNQSQTASLSWSAPAGGADSYVIGIIPLNGQAPSNVVLPGTATSVTRDTGGLPVCYLVAAIRGATFGITDALCGVPGFSTLSSASGGFSALALEAIEGTLLSRGLQVNAAGVQRQAIGFVASQVSESD